MKDLKDICFTVSARLSSTRLPRKMIKPFANTNLIDIACKKVLSSKIIPKENFFFSAYEKEIVNIVESNNLQVYHRSKESALADGPLQLVMEYHDKLDYKYMVQFSACNPLLTVETIDNFIEAFMESPYEGMFSVIRKKNYFWDKNHEIITPWPEGIDILNTKLVEESFEAAHCLFAGRLDSIGKGYWMAEPPFKKNSPVLFEVSENETFDIDYPWQFKVAELLYSQSK